VKCKSKESTPRGRGFDLPPKRGLPLHDMGYLISNAKAQMSNECQRPKFKTVIGLTEMFGHLFIWISLVIWILTFVILTRN
jgi:hypothetical protein